MNTQESFDPFLEEMYKHPKSKSTPVEQDPKMCADFAEAVDSEYWLDLHAPLYTCVPLAHRLQTACAHCVHCMCI